MAGNEHKIVKNAGALYLRTGISILIQLLAVRYLLKYLGTESYGLYGLIASIIWVAESIKGTFSTTIQRFLNIELGRKNIAELKEIFNASFRIVATVAIICTILALAGGFCLLPFLKIPVHLQTASRFILLFSSFTLGFHLLTTVFDAAIIAHEKFLFLAMVGIGQSVLRLISVLCLVFFPTGRVIWYALFIMLVAAAVLIINWLYCRTKFKEIVVYSQVTQKHYYKNIGSFISFKVFGTITTAIQSSGIDFVLNIFGGLPANTARTITYQVINAVNVLVWNLVSGFSPRCITLYGEGNYAEFNRLVLLMMKCNLFINITLGFVISLFVEPILQIWLGEVPEYTPWFIRIVFLYFIVRVIEDALNLIVTTAGKIKQFQLYLGASQIISVCLSAVVLWLGAPYYSAFLSMTVMEIIFVVCALFTVNKVYRFDLKLFLRTIVMPGVIYLGLLIAIFAGTFNHVAAQQQLMVTVMSFLVALILSGILGLFLFFGKNAFTQVKALLLKKY